MALRPGQDLVISFPEVTADCQVIAAAGAFVLVRAARADRLIEAVPGDCTLTFLDGMVPTGWDGTAVWGSEPGELRFHVADDAGATDRRSSVRLPIFAEVMVASADTEVRGQVLDVSAGGMRFRGTGRHVLGETLRVHVQLPGGPVIDAHGVVRLCEQSGVTAIEFTAFHAGSAQAVGAWTVARLRQALTPA